MLLSSLVKKKTVKIIYSTQAYHYEQQEIAYRCDKLILNL